MNDKFHDEQLDSTYSETLNRLLDGITPILVNMSSMPVVLENIAESLRVVNQSLLSLHNRIDSTSIELTRIESLLKDLEYAISLISQCKVIQDERCKIERKNVELEEKKMEQRVELNKQKWDIISKTTVIALGSGGVITLIIQAILEAFK